MTPRPLLQLAAPYLLAALLIVLAIRAAIALAR